MSLIKLLQEIDYSYSRCKDFPDSDLYFCALAAQKIIVLSKITAKQREKLELIKKHSIFGGGVQDLLDECDRIAAREK